MRHLNKKKILDRLKAPRKALVRGLLRNFFLRKKITTTLAKAKAIKPELEKCITRARQDNLVNRRYLLKKFNDPKVVDLLCKEIGPKYINFKGGYTRLLKLAPRKGDSAKIAKIELL